MKKLLVLISLALCMMLLVCSCGGNTDTNTDTSKETIDETDTSIDTGSDVTDTNTDTDSDKGSETPDDSGINLNDGKYRVFVCDENGKGIAGVFVQFCKDDICDFGETDAAGYLEIPTSEYHVAYILDQSGVYPEITYNETNYPVFENGSTLITITLSK